MARPGKSPPDIAVDLAIDLARKNLIREGTCGQCHRGINSLASDARFKNIFCSLACERAFIQEALRSLTVEQCILIQRRVEELLAGLEVKAPRA